MLHCFTQILISLFHISFVHSKSGLIFLNYVFWSISFSFLLIKNKHCDVVQNVIYVYRAQQIHSICGVFNRTSLLQNGVQMTWAFINWTHIGRKFARHKNATKNIIWTLYRYLRCSIYNIHVYLFHGNVFALKERFFIWTTIFFWDCKFLWQF